MSMNALTRFRAAVAAILVLLLLQFAAGMVTNLYVHFPESLPGGEAWTWSFAHSTLVEIHVVLGTLLLIASLVTIELGLWVGMRSANVTAVAGALLVAGAYLCGMWFLTYGQSDISSLCMALGFMGALAVYAVGFYVTRPEAGSDRSGRA